MYNNIDCSKVKVIDAKPTTKEFEAIAAAYKGDALHTAARLALQNAVQDPLFWKSYTDSATAGAAPLSSIRGIQIDPAVYIAERANATFFQQAGITVDNIGGEAAVVIQSLGVDYEGGFGITSTGTPSSKSNKLTLKSSQSQLPVFDFDVEAGFTNQQMQMFMAEGRQIASLYLEMLNVDYLQKIEDFLLFGRTPQGTFTTNSLLGDLAGNVTYPWMPTAAPTTANELYLDLVDLISEQRAAAGVRSYAADLMVISTSLYQKLTLQIPYTMAEVISILAALKRNYDNLNIAGAKNLRFLVSDRMTQGNVDYVAFISTEPTNVKIRMPRPLRIKDGRPENPNIFKMFADFRLAGLDVLRPVAGRILPLDLSAI